MRLTITLLSLLLWAGVAEAQISEKEAVYAVLGEAGPSYRERLAIAFALRNRGTLRGVYGYDRAKKVAWTGQDWQNATRAVLEAQDALPSDDITHGATHWLSDWDLKHAKPRLTAFRFKMVETAYHGTTHFYKEVK